VVVIVQVYVLIFVRCVSLGLEWDYVRFQWFVFFWVGDGALDRGLPFELMKINVLLAAYLGVMCRTLHPRREAAQRLGLVGAAVVLAMLQLAWAASYELLTWPRFNLVPLPM
jgi:hypothetical protein